MDPDPDPAIFASDLQDGNKKLKFFLLLLVLFEGTVAASKHYNSEPIIY
jgi:hypothetical protein